MYIRARSNGTFELRVIHERLPKPFYATFDSEAEGRAYGQRLEDALARGHVPPELQQKRAERSVPISVALRTYLTEAPIAKSDRPVVELLQGKLNLPVAGVTVRWVDDWVSTMKRVDRLAPGTIRKRVESLARAIDWWNRKEHPADDMPSNPLRTLPRGYSTYREGDTAPGEEPRRDEKRDRRLADGEAERIEAAILGWKNPERQRPLDMPDREAFLLLFRLIVSTGLRLREAYRLRGADIRFDLRTIHVSRSKRGRPRDVPMTRQVHDWLMAAPTAPDATVFPFWSGVDDEAELNRVSNKLSQRFAGLFAYTGCEDLTEHDLRHEATCRWMLMKGPDGHWLFRPEEVRRITGHISVQVFERYLSMRGSDLATRLW